jgi:hypothetical protein
MTVLRPAEPELRSASLADQAGDLECTQPGCDTSTGLRCEYVDRRGRACGTAWCPHHRLVIEGRVYCRRHAGVVSALPAGYAGSAAPMPDLENRAPSLVSWVAREVDADLRQLLLSEAASGEGTQLLTDPVYPVFIGRDRRRAWERAWKLVDASGRSLRVSLLVEECADAEVGIRVNSTIVGRLTPPWIVQRLHGAEPPPEIDLQRRKDFNRHLCGLVRRGIHRERPSRPPIHPGAAAGVADVALAAGWSATPHPPLS